MSIRTRVLAAALVLTAAAAWPLRSIVMPVSAQQTPQTRVFEVRTYVASAGKLEALKARFRDHTIRFFDRHNMTSIAYWQPVDGPGATTTIIYILAHESREAAQKNWAAFQADPEWIAVRNASNVDGNIVARVDSYFANPSDFSPIK